MTNKNLPRDVFLHILAMIALYVSAGSLIALLFQYINLFFPDPLNLPYYRSVADTIRRSMAALIIVFPVYLFSVRALNQDYRNSEEKRESKIRKWLVYFTLFAAASIIIGDLVALVYSFLGGELTARFMMKVLVMLSVSATIFGYYLFDLRGKLNIKYYSLLAWKISAVMLASVIFGFFTAGSPLKARQVNSDEQRINHLQILQNEIINYWLQKAQLPADLTDLRNDISGFIPPVDPENNQEYGYNISGKLSFELCANFNLSSAQSVASIGKSAPVYYMETQPYQQNWQYQQGKTCFERTIDPDLYKDRIGLKPPRF
ncbi:MAG: hypothetical protein A3I89_00965 [Candidatus Harrisonbacteria bacterium RIFCSPLOWO2_02_FULL_41_11]|uniref:DUF5671 domain-containing protein n=1 Tax=Candidatus Harrisonbacteria bacterium RIFCSPHIGHO2_02_FULL_42_16 TaxID=1798404 RepID=A0A1G1ZF38_9BACT|nr:MAG: hypothetical protein A3B92_03750 [Candidatus Harrisonbacteria bacterium RIFCSPHIGHO2_02_FULL_42_16]OGY66982.1 MAG: hypothetical protein A3I89_00965 [Candidatus Harrisonbacteria bacterium RIFCSPLOWO2_02_FULL_41_11]